MTSRCEPGLQKNVTKLPPKTERARERASAFAIFLTTKQTFREVAKVENVCTCMNFSTCHCTRDLGQKKLVVIRLWLGRRSWLSEKSRTEVKRLPELQNGKIRQKSEAKAKEKNDRHKASKSIHKHKRHER